MRGIALFFIWAVIGIGGAGAADRFNDHVDLRVYAAPKVHPAPELDQEGVKAIFYEGLEYQGKPTRVFAYVGVPKIVPPEGGTPERKKAPGMVLVHGGGGTAFDEWVRVWNARGYAAISMDLEGHTPGGKGPSHPGHAWSGPARDGMFNDAGLALKDQWMVHALSDVMLAETLLGAMEEVDPERIGVTGISWGGVLTSLAAGVDRRFKCAVPVYGCGFLYDSKSNFGAMRSPDPAVFAQRKYWDPARYFVDAAMPMLWVGGDRDAHFSVDILSRSREAVTKAPSTLCIHPAMAHGHMAGWDPDKAREIYTFADSVLKGGAPLARVTRQPAGRNAVLGYESKVAVTGAEAWYLSEPLRYEKKARGWEIASPWKRVAGKVDAAGRTAAAELPESAVTYYLNIIDERGCVVSSNVIDAR